MSTAFSGLLSHTGYSCGSQVSQLSSTVHFFQFWKFAWCLLVPTKLVLEEEAFISVPAQWHSDPVTEVQDFFIKRDLVACNVIFLDNSEPQFKGGLFMSSVVFFLEVFGTSRELC